jgi:hypothetical protein
VGDGGRRHFARVLARLPRLEHLRLLNQATTGITWGFPEVAAELARCPALRVLEIDRAHDPLWRHELGPARGAHPRVPRPSSEWPPFAEALHAGGCRAALRPAPDSITTFLFEPEFEVEI